MGSKKEEKTVSYYDKHARDWASAHHGFEKETYWKGEMEKFKKLLPEGRVLEVGSGTGKDAEALLEMGYDYVGTDASKGLLKLAKERNPRAKFLLMDVLELDLPENSFDGFWTVATLLHISKNKIQKAMHNLHKVVKKGGIGFISLKKGEGEKKDEETGRWFSYYSTEEFVEVLEKSSFRVLETAVTEDDRNTWLTFFVEA